MNDWTIFWTIEDKEYIIIKVSKGIDIYYLKEKGIVKGTYLRTGSCSIPATEEKVNPFTFKLAVDQSNEKNNFLDKKEFKGSILEIYDTIIDYLKNNTATYGLIQVYQLQEILTYNLFLWE